MAKSRKNKKHTQATPSNKRDYEVTKTFFDKFSEVARKTLQLMDLDPALYDKFTKKQKLEMMQVKFAPPHFEAMPGHQVPRHYIREVQKRSTEYMEYQLIGDPALNLSYYDYLTMGSQFGTYCSATYRDKLNCAHADIYKLIAEQVQIREDFGEHTLMRPYFEFLRAILGNMSQFNYRMYGFSMVFKQPRNRLMMAAFVQITSIECEKKSFVFDDKKRPAFRLLMPNFMERDTQYVDILSNRVFENELPVTLLKLYIQSHALHRMKERLDTLSVLEKNIYLILGILKGEKIRLANGSDVFEMIDKAGRVIAYLPFKVQDDCVVILTLLPVTSPGTPIGKKLCQTLGVSKAELELCGMDKLSYFVRTDFDKIPKLKQALEVNNLMYLTEYISLYKTGEAIVRTTGISGSIFRKERTHEEVLNEMEGKY